MITLVIMSSVAGVLLACFNFDTYIYYPIWIFIGLYWRFRKENIEEKTVVKEMKRFSLIMATYGREKEVDSFLKSIKKSNYDLELVEVIIVDQNDKISLNPIVENIMI